MAEPLVAVIMPSLNVKKYLKTCMDSVVGQTLRGLEILCVDAGSTDGTLELLEDYARSDERVRVIKSDVRSYGRQVNLGMDLARAKYVAVVETDDYLDPHMYERLYAAAEENQLDFIKADFLGFRVLRNGAQVYDEGRIWEEAEGKYGRVLSAAEAPELWVRDVNIWKGLYNREFLTRKGIRLNETPGAAFQDIGFCHLLLHSAKRGMYIRDMLYFYRRGRAGASSSTPRGLLFARQEYKRMLETPVPEETEERFFHFLYVRMAYVFIGEYEKALESGRGADGEYREAASWFRAVLGEAVRRGRLSQEDVEEEVWQKLRRLSDGEEAYAAWWRRDREKREAAKRRLLEEMAAGGIIIFGCGKDGERCLLFCDEHQVEVAGFCDNNAKLWGKRYYGYEVCAPGELIQKHPEEKVVIATRKYGEEIREQLKKMGVGADRMVLLPSIF